MNKKIIKHIISKESKNLNQKLTKQQKIALQKYLDNVASEMNNLFDEAMKKHK